MEDMAHFVLTHTISSQNVWVGHGPCHTDLVFSLPNLNWAIICIDYNLISGSNKQYVLSLLGNKYLSNLIKLFSKAY